MDLHKLYEGCRTYRRFKQDQIPAEILEEIAETARTRSCAMNGQVLKFLVVSSPVAVKNIQPCLTWAAKLPKEIGTPKEDKQPTAFIILLEPEKAHAFADIDLGIAIDTMAITAWSHGVGSCMLGAVNKAKLAEAVSIPEGYVVRMVLALGYPDHKSNIVDLPQDGSLNYYVDENRDYYVPKKSSADVIICI